MNEPSSPHEDPHSLVGWYVVDELDAEQRDGFEAHLPGCDNCTREVSEFRETTAELAALTVAGPPPSLRQSVLETIRTVRPLPPITVDPSGPDGFDQTPTPADPAADDLGHDLPPADELAARRARRPEDRSVGRRPRRLIALIAAAAAVVIAFGAVVVNLNGQRQAEVAAQAAAQRESDLLAAPDVRVVTRTRGEARYRFVASRERNEGLFLASGLPDPGSGNVYQLWTLQGSRVTPDATLSAATTSQWFTGPIRTSTSLAITIEPDGGSPQPTTPILAQAAVS